MQLVFGVLLGVAIGAAIIALDVAGIGSLADGPTALVLIIIASILIFAPLVVATAIGLLAYEE